MSKIAGAHARLFEDAATWPMYQLLVLFMITDPRTVVRSRRWQVIVAVIIALVETLLRFAADQAWTLPVALRAAPPLVALWLVGPAAKALDVSGWLDRRPARVGGSGATPTSPAVATP